MGSEPQGEGQPPFYPGKKAEPINSGFRLFDKIEWEPPLNSEFRLAPVARIEWEPPHSILAFSVFFITQRSFSVLRGGPHSIFSKRRPPENSEILEVFSSPG